MTKSFIALKTTLHGKSIWAINPAVCQTYRVGERVQCKDPRFPFFICSKDAIFGSGHVRCGAEYTEVLVIQVFARDLGHIQPWVNQVNDTCLDDNFDYIQALYRPRYEDSRANRVDYQFTAQRLKVLASYSACDANDKLKEWSRQMHLPILTIDCYLALHPECSRY